MKTLKKKIMKLKAIIIKNELNTKLQNLQEKIKTLEKGNQKKDEETIVIGKPLFSGSFTSWCQK
jgi:hypothetical protein